jgi:hypothetical protein
MARSWHCVVCAEQFQPTIVAKVGRGDANGMAVGLPKTYFSSHVLERAVAVIAMEEIFSLRSRDSG